jgi:hypothetical protein
MLKQLIGVWFWPWRPFRCGTWRAASSHDNFYKGKTIRLIVAFSAGGGYDTTRAPSGAI